MRKQSSRGCNKWRLRFSRSFARWFLGAGHSWGSADVFCSDLASRRTIRVPQLRIMMQTLTVFVTERKTMVKHLSLFLAWYVLVSGSLAAADASKPNFIIINIDDLGYADIGPYGSNNRKPQLDRMAREGRKLTSHYAAPVCSPSRAALMTGCYPQRVVPLPGV